ncbi:MAG: hypothetical protein Q4E52_03585 [Fibrobacter sp.]|nr:hypothetical protein [Fibrobacter sp.]
MSIRKHWGKITLGIAASFWAGCNDSGTEAEYIQGGENICTNEQNEECVAGAVIALYGVAPTYDISSSSITGDCAEGNCVESSSGMGESSSSVNSEYPYVLYSDPSVHCKDSTVYVPSPCENASKSYASTDENAPLYGIVPIVCNTPSRYDPIFKCDNGDSLPAYRYKEKDGIIYTNKEYDELFGSN